MSDFHKRVAATVAEFEGVTKVRFVSPGARGCHCRRHPHLSITLVNGVVFPHPLRGRPIDGCTGYFKSVVAAIRKAVRSRVDDNTPKDPRAIKRKVKRHRIKRWALSSIPGEPLDVPAIRYCGPPVSTAPSPFAALANLVVVTATPNVTETQHA